MATTLTLDRTGHLRRLLRRLWDSRPLRFAFDAMASVTMDTPRRG